ncbi:MAG TPA: alpha/beta hydrolase [Verrucomicrobiales bacterium]|nr:alpha/beta hydrolase [Verrucomicrobiales bacterium]
MTTRFPLSRAGLRGSFRTTTRLIVSVMAAAALQAAAAPDPAGYWEGAIELPGVELEIHVDLLKESDLWKGSISIPVQGLTGFPLGNVSVEEDAVSFVMSGIPGDPEFRGKIAEESKTISGEFRQSGQTYPFRLERKEKRRKGGATPEKGVPGEGFAGPWQGSLKVQVFELRLVLKLTEGPEGLTGTIDSVDQGARDIPLSTADGSERKLQLEVESIGASYEGALSDDGSEIAGEWKQGGRGMQLVFKRLAVAPDFRRPQEPDEPYPYQSIDVEFEGGGAGVRLAGTLTLPLEGSPHPAVVLLSGSGPQDRDEALMGHRPFLVLADHLTRQGIAVLRFDDRGVGKSTGDFAAATHEDFASDAVAAVDYLKSRPEIDAKRIGLAGHSEGGITAPLAAVERPDDVAFLVLMAGVGVPLEQLLYRQGEDIARAMGATPEMIEKNTEMQRKTFAIVKGKPEDESAQEELMALAREQTAEFTPEQRETMGLTDEAVAAQIQMVLSPWFCALLAYDPAPALRKVRCPVLAVNGAKDLQVAAKENLNAIEAALREGGNSAVETVEFPGLNHLFQTSKTGAPAEYATIDETWAPAALEAISGWILRTVKLAQESQ